ncbi:MULTISPECIES: hypothetical protein [unclassified Pseudoalteromonas]|uniref:hypothetical protein n=1 Tax=unclassified Pseudoalteromonas TaxID=194690 RepID=UPI0025B43633|nr:MULTISPECIES: hypothetical protein [unclassified Pseudoalteromonas]MDN3394584.1 hypothetical protein [Pseudoalteromonas sp. APC 3215]MDN3469644.1 hypothetical protein [Pseudoalteromonas sp. APC 4026]
MSAIANFKKRRLAEKAKQNAVAETGKKLVDTMKGLADEAKETTALKLLAQLLGCDESKAIETAQQYVDQNITFFCEDDLPTLHVDSEKEQVDVSNIEDATDELNESINTASNAAGDIESAADKASDVASDLAYQADDINAANSDLKDTVEELKKPSAAQKSSNSKSKTKQKNNSKK